MAEPTLQFNVASFNDYYKGEIERFFLRELLFSNPENFTPAILSGLLNLLDSLSDYKEEGRSLSPQILVISSLFYLTKRFRHFNYIRIGSFEIPTVGQNEFEKILKLCAPLATGSWVIYIEVNQFASPPYIEFGLLNPEENEISLNVEEQLNVERENIKSNIKAVFIRNIGLKSIHMAGLLGNRLTLSFSSNIPHTSPYDCIEILSKYITKEVSRKGRKKFGNYLKKIIFDAINRGHGTLIGVIKNGTLLNEENLFGLKFDAPIDLNAIFEEILATGAPHSYHAIRQFSHILAEALNNDGITIFSQDGKFLGYHFIIHKKSHSQVTGGARSQAFEAMKESEAFTCCFYKSQDGKTKIWPEK